MNVPRIPPQNQCPPPDEEDGRKWNKGEQPEINSSSLELAAVHMVCMGKQNVVDHTILGELTDAPSPQVISILLENYVKNCPQIKHGKGGWGLAKR